MKWEKDVSLDKVHYINNGVDLEVYHRQEQENVYLDEDLDRTDTFKIMYTGSMGVANCMYDILNAAELVKDKADIRFLLFGGGYLEQELKEYCRKKGLTNVIFKGKVDKKYIPFILSKGNVNIMTGEDGRVFGYGLSLNKMFDYMASGKPIISNIQTQFDILAETGCGVTTEDKSPESLAVAILQFYDMSEEELKEYSVNAKKAVRQYDFESLTNELEQVLEA
jgi:glycosyltransferase involved in cell wall biosynthesis